MKNIGAHGSYLLTPPVRLGFAVIVPVYPELISPPATEPAKPESMFASLVDVGLKVAISDAPGCVSSDQLASHDHFSPSPTPPPQVPSVPSPSQVRTTAWAEDVKTKLTVMVRIKKRMVSFSLSTATKPLTG